MATREISSQEMITVIDRFRNNPVSIQRYVVQSVEEMSEGKTRFVDATNPAILAIDAACMTSAAAVMRNNANMRKLYPMLATTEDELYLHMSDKDYLDRFYSPARTTLTIFMLLDEVKQKAVTITEQPNVRKLTIPKHSEITVSDYSFTLQYAIDIRVSAHGGITIVYDTTKESPIYKLTNNQVEWSAILVDGKKYLQIQLPVYQMKIHSFNIPLNAVTGFVKSYNFTDSFYFCRAFSMNTLGQWDEIRTTHTDQVYDPSKPTVVLKVFSNKLNVQIPQIYFNTNDANARIGDNVRIDIYTTKGPLEVDLTAFEESAFTAKWLDRDSKTESIYSAPLNSFSGLVIFSGAKLTGGKVGLSFEQLRERVNNRTNSGKNIPITPKDLPTTLSDLGYSLVTNLDTVTNRQYLATRSLPPPTDGSSVTGAGCSVRTLQAKMQELALLPTVKDNGNRVTILPTTVYKSENGVISIVSQSTVNSWLSQSAEQRANTLNTTETLVTPFYYVLDATSQEFDARVYRLDAPEVVSKTFVADNIQNTGIAVSTKNYYFYKSVDDSDPESGYVLLVELQTDEGFRNLATGPDIGNPANSSEVGIHVHMSYVPPGDVVRQVFVGELVSSIDPETLKPVDDRYIFRFKLNTDFDIDKDHNLIFSDISTPTHLQAVFDLVIFLENYRPVGSTQTTAFNLIDETQVLNVNSCIDLAHERYELKFGSHLSGLWIKGRSILEGLQYLRYENDIPLTYVANVYEMNPNGTVKLTWNEGLQVFERNLLHALGEEVLDENDNVILKHHAGEVILDEFGQPSLVDGVRGIKRQVDMVFIDGRYQFANDEVSQTYKAEIVSNIVNWANVDIPSISQRLLERTELFYYPTTTLGYFQGFVGQGESATLKTDQHLVISYLITREGYNNPSLRDALTTGTVETISAEFDKATVSITDIITKLKTAAGDQIIDVSIGGFLENKYKAVTVENDSIRLTVGKRIVALSNQQLQIRDSVDVEFILMD